MTRSARGLSATAEVLVFISNYFGFGLTSAYNSIPFCCLRRNVGLAVIHTIHGPP